MNTQHIETLIVGAGQCGLATGYQLQRRGREFLIVDGNERIGDNWRQQWDSLRLFSSAKYDALPGMRFPAPAHTFPTKDQVADFLEAYAVEFQLPVRLQTRVRTLDARPNGGYAVAFADGTRLTCDNVVIATGSFGRKPYVPEFAKDLDPGIVQLHSSEYRRPSQLTDGPVLVVGTSHSGCDVAYEVAEHRPTTLSGRDTGEIPFSWQSRAIHAALPVVVFAWRHVLTRRTPMGRTEMKEIRTHGGPRARVKRRDLEARGVTWNESRVAGVVDGKPQLADGTVLDPATVVWCTGFQQDFTWIKLPIIGEDGWPQEYRGVVDAAPGLFFCGLSFQFAFSSMTFPGVARDSEYVAGRIAARAKQQPARKAAHARIAA